MITHAFAFLLGALTSFAATCLVALWVRARR
jgi:hypothetical protein